MLRHQVDDCIERRVDRLHAPHGRVGVRFPADEFQVEALVLPERLLEFADDCVERVGFGPDVAGRGDEEAEAGDGLGHDRWG